jgi:hypothetical protein
MSGVSRIAPVFVPLSLTTGAASAQGTCRGRSCWSPPDKQALEHQTARSTQ